MISDKDRSFYFGASDTSMVVANRNTKTFKKWWMVKLGLSSNDIMTKPMKVGNAYEHKIMKALNIKDDEMDTQIIIPELNLRVNYDAIQGDHIYEIKTYAGDDYKISKAYWRQAQAEMFAYLMKYGMIPKHTFIFYRVTESDYLNYFNSIDLYRISKINTVYDPEFCGELKVKLKELKECVEKGVMPK